MDNVTKLRPFDKIEIVRKCQQLSITQKLILLIIATHLGENEFCFISFNTLQKECCIKKRTALSHNLDSLINAEIIWRIYPSDGYKSNRYGINFYKLVTNGHQCGDPRLPVRSPTVTSAVTNGHPKRKINKVKKIKEESFVNKTEKAFKAIEEIRVKCNLKSQLKKKD